MIQGIKYKPFISTHSAREDGDLSLSDINGKKPISTHSAREDGDPLCNRYRTNMGISTHSAREDGDIHFVKVWDVLNYFNPLRPRGRRRRGPLSQKRR